MSDILNDIEALTPLKKHGLKFFLTWGLSIISVIISLAFMIGQLKSNALNKITTLESETDSNTQAIKELKLEHKMDVLNIQLKLDNNNTRIDNNNVRIDKLYYQVFNQKK